MSDQDARLISRIALERDVDTPLRRGVTKDTFKSPDYRDAFDFICRHNAKYSEVPTGAMIKREFPSLRLVKVEDGLDAVVDASLADHRHHLVFQMVERQVALLEKRGSADDILAVAMKTIAEIEGAMTDTGIVNLTDDPVQRYHDYTARKNRPGGLLGISTGFPTIDKATLGLQPQQLVTIIAAPKTGKSQLALRMATTVHEAGYTPAFISFEMSNEEQQKRYDAMKFGLSHGRLLNGDLVASEEKKYEKGLESLKGAHPFILMDSTQGQTVSAIGAQVMSYKPDVLFIDGVYLMVDEVTGESNTAQALTNITRALKRLAQRLNIPIVITTQTLTWKMKKNKLDANSIGYSSSFYQDSDVIFGLERGDQEDEAYRLLKIVASRNCGPAEVDLDWDWSTGTFEEVSASAPTYVYGQP
jgi:replicative DNA helicase